MLRTAALRIPALWVQAWCLILLPAVSSVAKAELPKVSVTTLDGNAWEGSISALTAEALTVQTADGPQQVPLANLLAVSPKEALAAVEPTSPIRVALTDGSELVADSYTAADGMAKFGFAGQELEMRTRYIGSVRLQTPTPAIEAQWQKLLTDANVAGDLVLIRKGDAIDFVEGILGTVDAENVELELDGSKIPVKRSRIDGLIYFHRQAGEQPDPTAVVYLSTGSTLAAKTLAASDAGLAVETLAGFKATVPWDQMKRLDFSAGKIQYLNVAIDATEGALLPEEEKVTEFLPLKNPIESVHKHYLPRSNSWGVRRPLKLAGQTYERGLALRSRTELMYRVRGKYRRFQAVVGIDDYVAGQSNNVRLTISGDGRTLLDELIRGTDEPRTLDLDIEGVSRLDIKVDFGDDGLDWADLLNLCEARVTK